MELSQQIMPYAVRLLSRRRYATNELKKKLIKKFGSEEAQPETLSAIERNIARLVELKYLNDEEYVDLFIQDQLRSKAQGLRLIENKLRQKGIDLQTIQKYLEPREQGGGELDQAIKAAKKKASFLSRKTGDTTNPETRTRQKEKIFRFLASRGFSQGTCMKALKELHY
jgi:regulatory protein